MTYILKDSEAKVVIGQFGSSLTNIMFMNKDTLCVEIDKSYRKRYDVLCNMFEVRHALYAHHKGDLKSMKQKADAEKCDIDVDDFLSFIKKTVSP